MNSANSTISIVKRSVKLVEPLIQNKSGVKKDLEKTKPCLKPVYIKRQNRFTDEELEKFKSTLRLLDRQRLQEFLGPLNIADLKTLGKRETYDCETASKNWQVKNFQKNFQSQSIVYEETQIFKKLIKYLVDLTPSNLKQVNNEVRLNHIMEKQVFKQRLRVDNFHEITQFPDPITKKNFEEYIYNLTHIRHHFLLSSSLKSGIIPLILLYTHNLANEKFAPYRSTTTFNHLIKYFGIDKNQNLLAREILLVMRKDGHHANQETIDNLLRMCKTHSHIRSISSTFSVVLKYLKLSDTLGIDVTLDTWTRVYDTIRSPQLKEYFLKVLQGEQIPMTRGLVMRVLDDYMETTNDTEKVIHFIENDLNFKNWRCDNKVVHKIVEHRCRHGYIPEIGNNDDYSLLSLLYGLAKNKSLTFKSKLMFEKYCKFTETHCPQLINIYKVIIRQLIDDFRDLRNIPLVNFLIRGLVHDATQSIGLPVEYYQYDSSAKTIPENYKMISNIVKSRLFNFQALIDVINSKKVIEIREPWTLLSDNEIVQWEKLKKSNNKWDGFIEEQTKYLPKQELELAADKIRTRARKTRQKNQIERLSMSDGAYLRKVMLERGLIKETNELFY
ncbi:AEP3 [Candida oxycetoniae]|uniref:AEP3 n=1 Tax=Candida oxycetoniae TaxID=497107 RepID=A0AAI9SV24_9ASCO|nr:AEP3 [Candida oxycetoniae]KAI3403239.2 AEP3 [Candida oxycetoniae]